MPATEDFAWRGPGLPRYPVCPVPGENFLQRCSLHPSSQLFFFTLNNASSLVRSLKTPCLQLTFWDSGSSWLRPPAPILPSERCTWIIHTLCDMARSEYFPHLSLIANNKIKHQIATKTALPFKSSPFSFKHVCETCSLETNVFLAYEFR